MKRILLLPIIAAFLLPMGCTKDFESINTDPNAASPASFDANFFLSNAQNTYQGAIGGYAGPILFQSGWVQLLSSTTSGGATYYGAMDKYVYTANTYSYTANSWGSCFRSASLAQQIVKDFSADPARANVVSAAIVVKALALLYATDVYGDIPYTEALQGETGITTPAYSAQSVVLKGLLSELDGAVSKFDAAKPKPTADLFYAGDVAKWKKLANSLMLRIAMRFTKREPAFAKQWAEKAFAGGTMTSAADDCFMKGDFSNGYQNPYAGPLNTPADVYSVRWSEKMINYLKGTSDPRLGVIAEVPADGLTANENAGVGNNDPSVQIGQPNGWDLNALGTDISKSPNYPGGTTGPGGFCPIGKYSRPRSSVYLDRSGPLFILTYGETELLLAEAAAWGFGVGSAASHYANGVKGAMQSLAAFGGSGAIASGDIDTYVANNPLDVSSSNASLKQINEQFWASTGSLMMFAEAWTNWRRSGYPVLTPVNYASNFSNGAIPRRQLYPQSEAAVNGANLAEGIKGLSAGDTWVSRVWWDQ